VAEEVLKKKGDFSGEGTEATEFREKKGGAGYWELRHLRMPRCRQGIFEDATMVWSGG
jgi:hypothetical protein